MATNSRSADKRPNAMSRPISTAIGMLMLKACGSSVTHTRMTTVQGTPWAMSV